MEGAGIGLIRSRRNWKAGVVLVAVVLLAAMCGAPRALAQKDFTSIII
jgi:predicted cobalt transporter CbtA